jgi:hypothetical protein
MKEAADTEKFRNFAEAHRRRIYQKMLARCATDAATHSGLQLACSQVADCSLTRRSMSN